MRQGPVLVSSVPIGPCVCVYLGLLPGWLSSFDAPTSPGPPSGLQVQESASWAGILTVFFVPEHPCAEISIHSAEKPAEGWEGAYPKPRRAAVVLAASPSVLTPCHILVLLSPKFPSLSGGLGLGAW